MTIPRILIGIAVLLVAGWHSREALGIASGVVAALTILLWRASRETAKPLPLGEEPLQRMAERLPAAEIRGDSVRTTVGGRPAAVEVYLSPTKSGPRVPAMRVRVRVNTPIPFCFTVRRRNSPLALDALVANTPLEKPEFEYELSRVHTDDADIHKHFEAAANLPRLMSRLLATHLEEALGDQIDAHDFRLEELTYDGSRISVILQPAEDPEKFDLGESAVARAETLVEAVETFIRAEGLEEASRE